MINRGFSVFQIDELLKLVLTFWLDLTEAPRSWKEDTRLTNLQHPQLSISCLLGSSLSNIGHLNSEVTNVFLQPAPGISSRNICNKIKADSKEPHCHFKCAVTEAQRDGRQNSEYVLTHYHFYNTNDRMNNDYILISLLWKPCIEFYLLVKMRACLKKKSCLLQKPQSPTIERIFLENITWMSWRVNIFSFPNIQTMEDILVTCGLQILSH